MSSNERASAREQPQENQTICLPIAAGQDYGALVKDTKAFRAYLDKQIEEHPELFPKEINGGYCLHGFVESQRLEIRTRRLRLQLQ